VSELRLDVLVVPRASMLAFGPVTGGRIKIRLPAPPVDGAANDALVRALADELGLSRRQVAIVAGATGRRKTVALSALDAAAHTRIQEKVTKWSVG
jgi:uncharacterized protein YggU (UPF0235/DUF167 family)